MARQKGMLNLSGNLEPLAGAPLDSRDITPTVADLYVASNWPYKYIGMKTTVTATGDTYRLVNLDVTQESSWVKEGSGGSGASSLSDLEDVDLINPEEGETLIYDGEGGWTNGPAGQTYSDFTGATSQAAGAHGLVPAPTTADVDKYLKGDGSWGAIEMPNFDYSNEFGAENIYSTTEKMIGQWTDGKPLYKKTITGTTGAVGADSILGSISNVDTIVTIYGQCEYGSSGILQAIPNKELYLKYQSGNIMAYTDASATSSIAGKNCVVNVLYTKTTDSAMSIGTPNDYSTTEKIVGTWIDGKPLYQKTWTGLSISHTWNGDKFASATFSKLSNDIDKFISMTAYDSDGCYSGNILKDENNWNTRLLGAITMTAMTIRYTKTS